MLIYLLSTGALLDELATATMTASSKSGTIKPPEVADDSSITSGSIIGSAIPPAKAVVLERQMMAAMLVTVLRI